MKQLTEVQLNNLRTAIQAQRFFLLAMHSQNPTIAKESQHEAFAANTLIAKMLNIPVLNPDEIVQEAQEIAELKKMYEAE